MSNLTPVILLCGLDANEQEAFSEFTSAVVSQSVRLVIVTDADVSLTLAQAWTLPHRHHWGKPGTTTAAALCTNLSGTDVSNLMDICRDSKLPRLVWAIGRPQMASRTLEDYLQELLAERAEFVQAASYIKKGGSKEPPRTYRGTIPR